MSSQFDVIAEHAPGQVVVRPIGELDIATAPQLAAAVERWSSRDADLVIDLSGLSFMDCAGLRVLLYANARANSNGVNLRLIRGGSMVQRVLRLAGLEDRLPFDAGPDARTNGNGRRVTADPRSGDHR